MSGHRVIQETEAGSLPTFAVFFALIGAEIHLSDFQAVAPFALLLALGRAGGLFGGVMTLGKISGADDRTRRLTPFGMLPQAGIAIALATAIGSTFAPWGPFASTLLLGTIVVNELVGPVIFRLAVGRSGEAGQRHDHPLAEQAPHAPAQASDPAA